jgi:methionine synthase II (cobalamin-independent)
MIETPEEVAARIRKVLEVVPAERVYLSTDCGMKALPRIVARLKLKALADGARMVRQQLTSEANLLAAAVR